MFQSATSKIKSNQLNYTIKIFIQPLVVNLRQETLNFMLKFIGLDPNIREKTVKIRDKQSKNNSSIYKNIHQKLEINKKKKKNKRIKRILIEEFWIEINYIPTNLDIGNLIQRNPLEFLNIVSIRELRIKFKRFESGGFNTLGELEKIIREYYYYDITQNQKLNMIKGSSIYIYIYIQILGISPITSIYNIFSGMADIIKKPVEHYKRDGRIVRGISEGFSSFATNITHESSIIGRNVFIIYYIIDMEYGE